MSEVPQFGPGWRADLPDVRDVTPATPEIKQALQKLRRRRSARAALPAAMDLREYCLPPTDQGALQSSSAHAVLGMLGYFERRALGRTFSGSARFLYRTARRLDGIVGDNGVSLRTTLKAVSRFGCPPQRFWPEDAAHYDDEPDGNGIWLCQGSCGAALRAARTIAASAGPTCCNKSSVFSPRVGPASAVPPCRPSA